MKDFIDAFRALRHAPLALWMVIFAFSADAMAYFGILPLMASYLEKDIHIAPAITNIWVSVFTCALTIVMIFVKPIENKFGIRGGMILALVLTVGGRAIYGSAPFAGARISIAIALAIVAIGEGVMQPIAYAGIKRYTDEKNAAMGYAMLYAVMNLAQVPMGPISSFVRTTWDHRREEGLTQLSGFNAVNWTCFGITVFTLVAFVGLMTPKREAVVARKIEAGNTATAQKTKSPWTDVRFMFFIFMLLPVRTLFAHQFHTMPKYVLRAYDQSVADHMEWIVDSMNPLIIFFGVPIFTALTNRVHVYTMMIIGTFVSAGATFILCTGVHTSALLIYILIFSIGEALWSSRFLQYAAELAPEGRAAQYMGVANLPWFVAKLTTGLYAGWMLERFCPAVGPKDTTTMWLIYGLIAMTSPIGLVLARRWVMAGMQVKAEPEPTPA